MTLRHFRAARWFAACALLITLVTVVGAAVGSAQAAFPSTSGKIAFTSDRDGNWEIYAMNADGSGQTNLTGNTATDFLPGWSPDGSRVAFASNRDVNFEIYVMNADGSGQTNLTQPSADATLPGARIRRTSPATSRTDASDSRTRRAVIMPVAAGKLQFAFPSHTWTRLGTNVSNNAPYSVGRGARSARRTSSGAGACDLAGPIAGVVARGADSVRDATRPLSDRARYVPSRRATHRG